MLTTRWCFGAGLSLPSKDNPGNVTTVVTRKKGTHPSASASLTPDDASEVRPTEASEDSGAY